MKSTRYCTAMTSDGNSSNYMTKETQNIYFRSNKQKMFQKGFQYKLFCGWDWDEKKKKKTSWLALQFSLVNQPQKTTFIYQDWDCLHWGMLMAEVTNILQTVGPKNYSPSLCKVCKSPKGKVRAISSLKGGLKLIKITFQLFQLFTS